MPVIYEPSGKAKEYSELAANLYDGCPHACLYCWVPDMLHKNKTDFHKQATPREDVLDRLKIDARKLGNKGERRPVLLCFTCDPYPPAEIDFEITRQAIQTLHSCGLNFTILTKGGELAQRDFDLYQDGDSFGTTLTLYRVEDFAKWEPKAAPSYERVDNLKEAHRRGIRTWVSLEPVIYPAQTLEIIKWTAPLVDEYKVGTLNYMAPPEPIDWPKFARDAIDLLESLHKPYLIKKDLAKYLTAGVK